MTYGIRPKQYRGTIPREELERAVPWRSTLLEDLEPLLYYFAPGNALILRGADLEALAGLPKMDAKAVLPGPGELCGAVVLPDVPATSLIYGRSGVGGPKLKANVLQSLFFDGSSRIELRCFSRSGTVKLWLCAASAPVHRVDIDNPVAQELPQLPACLR